DVKQYAIQTIYVRFCGPVTPIQSKQDLLSSPHCKLQPAPGYQRVLLAEFLPLARPTPAPAGVSSTKASPAKTLKLGDKCPVCGAEVKVRNLLNGTFVGCLC